MNSKLVRIMFYICNILQPINFFLSIIIYYKKKTLPKKNPQTNKQTNKQKAKLKIKKKPKQKQNEKQNES